MNRAPEIYSCSLFLRCSRLPDIPAGSLQCNPSPSRHVDPLRRGPAASSPGSPLVLPLAAPPGLSLDFPGGSRPQLSVHNAETWVRSRQEDP